MGEDAPERPLDDATALTAIRSGNETAFAALVEHYRLPLQVHCYRMLGSVDDAEDMVQETLLRAWRSRDTFEGRSTVKTWLYRIATNVCLNALGRSPRRIMPADLVPAADPGTVAGQEPDWQTDLPWLQPYPDSLLDAIAPSDDQPDIAVIRRETIELTYLAVIQHLPPRQRAVLILRDALGWSAREAADTLGTSVASVNSALQRARSTMRERLPERRADWRSRTAASDDEREILQRYIDAHQRHDVDGVVALLRDDVRQSMPPAPLWLEGRAAVGAVTAAYLSPGASGDFHLVPTAANRLPAVATYLRPYGESEYSLIGLAILHIEDGKISEITGFTPDLLRAFNLPTTPPR